MVVIWGDDQYENFKEDIIPAFCVLAFDHAEVTPWKRQSARGLGSNTSGARTPKPPSVFRFTARQANTWRVACWSASIDVAYAYQPLHHEGIGHAFVNTVLFLDYDRTGFPYPILPFQVNCYGSRVIAQHGYRSSLAAPLDGGRPRSSIAIAQALPGGRRGDGASLSGEPVARGADRFLELVACVSY